jgi:hypothetical protein
MTITTLYFPKIDLNSTFEKPGDLPGFSFLYDIFEDT